MKSLYALIAGTALVVSFPAFAGRDAGQLLEQQRSIEALKQQKEMEASARSARAVAGRPGPEGREGSAGEPAKPKYRGGHPKDAYPRY
jgi:hypothetical protein